MVYFGKKQGGGPLPTNIATTDGNNTFTGSNSFTLPVVVPDPTQNNQAANKQYVDTALATKADTTALTAVENKADANTAAIAGCAKLATDNTFTGTNTFNNPLSVGTNGFKTTETGFTIVEQVNQSGKQINIDFNQPTGDYKNYCSLAVRYKFKTQNYIELIKFENRPDSNEGVYISTPLNKFDFGNKELTSIATPTTAGSAATKAYVDGRTTTYKWEGTVNNGSDQNLETIGWDKHIIGAVVFRKRSDGQWFCINNNMTQQLYRLDGTGQFKLYGADVSNANPTWTNDYKVYITYIA